VGPHPAVAAVRYAVRASLAGLEPGDLVLVACSGGADSLALADALAFEAPRAAIMAGGVTVDHGLQPGSAVRADQVTQLMTRLGLSPARSVAVTVTGPGGPEAAARTARYEALDQAAETTGAVAVLLGHTLDDQAETVLLGLARGSGARSLAGMAGRTGRYLRPLLQIRREQTRAACAAAGLEPWDDPHNSDLAFMRARVRWQLMPVLTEALGPGAPEALARTAELLRADADALDGIAAAEIAGLGGSAVVSDPGWPVTGLAALPPAIRHRMLRQAAIDAGSPPGALSRRHISSLDELVTAWHGQRWADLPGGVRGERKYGRLLITRTSGPEVAPLATSARSEEPGGREGHGVGSQGRPHHG
jgi:tRNA(Ile)-lysidine synthase